MNIILEITVCAVKDDDKINFNFTSKELAESWCIGPAVSSNNTNPIVDQNIRIYGRWVYDASGTKVFFNATHIESHAE